MDLQKSLFIRYFTICAAIILVSITSLGVVLLGVASQYLAQDKMDLLKRNVRSAASITVSNYRSNSYQYVDQTLTTAYGIVASVLGADVFLTDTRGKTLICTEGSDCVHRSYLVDPSIVTRTLSGEYSEIGTLGGIYKEQYYTVAMPVTTETGQVVGVVFASTSAQDLLNLNHRVTNLYIAASLVVVLVSFVAVYVLSKHLVTPLREMVNATVSFAKGNFSVRVPVRRDDEIGRLAASFNSMAEALAVLEQSRRSFVANVSHELKTPMTTIAGFIDGMLDGTIPPERHEHYLEIVSNEVKRLSRLVVSMLNMARLESGELSLNRTVFDINEVVCSTIFTFEQRIDQKRLDIRGLEAGKVMVLADVDLMHQVVYNLIENAVKFTPEEGYLEVRYETRHGRVYVSIRNSGEGLSKDEIPRVFDRFYKTDKSRSLDKNGVGLGLYIVNTIINLHGGEIVVSSVQGEFCEFTFSVPSPSKAEVKRSEKGN